MIDLPEESLHRLRQMRDDLDWVIELIDERIDKNQPYRHYRVNLKATQGVVGSLIRKVEYTTKESA